MAMHGGQCPAGRKFQGDGCHFYHQTKEVRWRLRDLILFESMDWIQISELISISCKWDHENSSLLLRASISCSHIPFAQLYSSTWINEALLWQVKRQKFPAISFLLPCPCFVARHLWHLVRKMAAEGSGESSRLRRTRLYVSLSP